MRLISLQVEKGSSGTGTSTTRGHVTPGFRNCSRHFDKKQLKREKLVKLSPLLALQLISHPSRRHQSDLHLDLRLSLHLLLLSDKVRAQPTKVKDRVLQNKVKLKDTAQLAAQCILKVKVKHHERQNCWKVVWF